MGLEYSFTSNTTDYEEDQIYYKFDWGDGLFSDWLGPYNSGDTTEASHIWTDSDIFEIRVTAKDDYGESEWSDSHTITIVEGPKLEIEFIRGGFFKVSSLIKNTGAIDAADVNWSIILKGGAFIGKETFGEDSILAENELNVESNLVIGFGPTTVTVTADIPDGVSDKREQNGFVFLFFINIKPGGSG